MEKTKEHEQIKLVDEILTRGVGTFVDPGGRFKKKLIAKIKGEYKKDIAIKFGVDPTRPDIHLGHAVVLRKLRQLQDLGCKVVFLVGDFTAQIGDPTGKSKIRPEIAQQEIEKNMLTFLQQLDKILLVQKDNNTKKILHDSVFSWIRNSDWYVGVTDVVFPKGAVAKITVMDVAEKKEKSFSIDANSFLGKAAKFNFDFNMQINELGKKSAQGITLISLFSTLRHISHSQLIERDMFQERIKSGEPLFMHEMLYPVIQGIDSDILANIYGSCDLEIGGTDQTFNMLTGRRVMEMKNKEPQAVLAIELLVGLDGKEKMSKSLDNYVGITDEPKMMFGKIMSIPDNVIPSYFELCTFTPMDEIEGIKKKLAGGKVNPRDLKMDLAQQIVAIYHGEAKSKEAKSDFIATFQNKELPSDMPEVKAGKGSLLVDALMKGGVVASKTEFRRLMTEGAIRKDRDEKLNDPTLKVTEDLVLKVGKHRFVKIVVE